MQRGGAPLGALPSTGAASSDPPAHFPVDHGVNPTAHLNIRRVDVSTCRVLTKPHAFDPNPSKYFDAALCQRQRRRREPHQAGNCDRGGVAVRPRRAHVNVEMTAWSSHFGAFAPASSVTVTFAVGVTFPSYTSAYPPQVFRSPSRMIAKSERRCSRKRHPSTLQLNLPIVTRQLLPQRGFHRSAHINHPPSAGMAESMRSRPTLSSKAAIPC